MSSLRDLIRLEIERGRLVEPFRASELRALVDRNGGMLGDDVAPEHLNSYLANHSTGPGDRVGEAVKRGGARLFIKHNERATYSLDYSDYEGEFEEGVGRNGEAEKPGRRTAIVETKRNSRKPPQGRPIKTAVRKGDNRSDIAAKFVDYLREKPFRILKTDRGMFRWEPASGPVCGWTKRVNEYRWNSSGWTATSAKIAKFVADLKKLERNRTSAGAAHDAERIFRQIKQWGNPSRGKYLQGAEVLRLLEPLWQSEPISRVDSTLTKLYAFARPDSYVIYDSRVAAAIMTIAEDIYRPKTVGNRVDNTVEDFRSEYRHLGLYNGSGGTRQRGYRADSGWRNAYGVVAAQMEANDLCCRIRDRLNSLKEDDRSNWTLREVEAVLFMEGY